MVTSTHSLEQRIRRELPSLNDEQARELADIVQQLVATFQPEWVYVFGSRARNDARPDSDVDLLVVVRESAEPGHRRDQAAYRAIHRKYLFPLEILVLTHDEFVDRLDVPASLPATVLREGKALYAA